MRTPAHAVMWELWRLSRWELAIRTLGQSVFGAGALFLLGAKPEGQEIGKILTAVVFMLMAGTSVFSSMWMNSFDNRQNGFTFHLGFTRPIGTTLLVALPMVYIACTAALCYLIPAALLRALFDLPLPLFSMATVIATACALFMMAVWSSRGPVAKFAGFMAMFVCLSAVAIHGMERLPEGFDSLFTSPNVLTTVFSFSAWHYAVLLLFFAGSIAATTLAVDRQRHGETLSIGGPKLERPRLAEDLLRRNRPFTWAAQAQFWFEMRRSGAPVLLYGLGAACVAFVGLSLLSTHDDFEGKTIFLWGVILALSPIGFLMMGADWLLGLKRKQGAVYLATFDATQAMSNGGLIFVKLAVLTTSVFIGWVAMASAAALSTAIWGDYHQWVEARTAIQPVVANVSTLWWACVALILAVNYVTASAMLISFGLFVPLYPRLVGGVFFVTSGHALLALWDAKHGWILTPLWEAYAWLGAAALVVATLYALYVTTVKGYLARKHVIAALVVWAVYVRAFVEVCAEPIPSTVSVPLPVVVLALAALSLPLLSVAIAPLVLACHRHR